MTKSWYLWQSGPQTAVENMAFDEALLIALPRLGQPVLRFYSWTEPAGTFGYSQEYGVVTGLTTLRPLIRRPTGGGLVPHDKDWTYSLLVPTDEPWYRLPVPASYQRLHEWLRGAFGRLNIETTLAPGNRPHTPGQCFVGAERFDLIWRGRKLAGAAQRRTRAGLLIQGSIQPLLPQVAKADWQQAMCDEAHFAFAVAWAPFEPDTALREQAMLLARNKYATRAHNERR